MAGKVQRIGETPGGGRVVTETREVQTEDEAIALALAMCPEGGYIEVHTAECDVTDCSCVPRRLTRGARA